MKSKKDILLNSPLYTQAEAARYLDIPISTLNVLGKRISTKI